MPTPNAKLNKLIHDIVDQATELGADFACNRIRYTGYLELHANIRRRIRALLKRNVRTVHVRQNISRWYGPLYQPQNLPKPKGQ